MSIRVQGGSEPGLLRTFESSTDELSTKIHELKNHIAIFQTAQSSASSSSTSAASRLSVNRLSPAHQEIVRRYCGTEPVLSGERIQEVLQKMREELSSLERLQTRRDILPLPSQEYTVCSSKKFLGFGDPPETWPTFQFVKKGGEMFVQAHRPDTHDGSFVLIPLIGNMPVPKSPIDRLVVAYYFILQNQFKAARDVLPYALARSWDSKEGKKLLGMLQKNVRSIGSDGLALTLAAIQLRLNVPIQKLDRNRLIKAARQNLDHTDHELRDISEDVLIGYGETIHSGSVPISSCTPRRAKVAPQIEENRGQENPDIRIKLFGGSDQVVPNCPERMPQVKEEYTRLSSVESRVSQPLETLAEYQWIHETLDLEEIKRKLVESKRAIDGRFEIAQSDMQMLQTALEQSQLTVEALLVLYAQGDESLSQEFPGMELSEMKRQIGSYLEARLAKQRHDRLLAMAQAPAKDPADVRKDLLEAITKNYDPASEDSHFFQVFEAVMEVGLTQAQVESLRAMEDPNTSVAVQLLMGKGKTFIMLPFLALLRADGKHVSMAMVPQSLSVEVSNRFLEVFGRGFRRLSDPIDIPKEGAISLEKLRTIERMLVKALESRGAIQATPFDLHALLVNEYKKLLLQLTNPPAKDVQEKLLCVNRIRVLVGSKGAVVADEFDDLLKASLEFIVAKGEPRPFETTAATLVSELVLSSADIAQKKGIKLDCVPLSQGRPCTSALFHREMKSDLVTASLFLLQDSNYVGQEEAERWKVKLKDKALESSIKTYLGCEKFIQGMAKERAAFHTIKGLSDREKERLGGIWFTLNQILPSTLEREWNKDIGYLDDQSQVIASPFGGAGFFTGTQFSNPFEQIACTVETLLRQGPPTGALRRASLRQVMRSETLTGGVKAAVGVVRVGARKRSIQKKRADLRAYLRAIVFPEIKEYPQRITSDPHTLVDSLFSLSAMSGTRWNLSHIPAFKEYKLDTKTEVNYLLRLEEKKRAGEISVHIDEQLSDDRLLLNAIRGIDGNRPLALIDAGGLLRTKQVGDFRVTMTAFAREIIEQRPDLEAVVFYDQEERRWMLKKGDLKAVPADLTRIAPEKRFTIYDQRHTFGADIAQSPNALAVTTLGKTTILRDYEQAVYRMRKIEAHQRNCVLVNADTAQAIRENLGIPQQAPIPEELSVLNRFLIVNQVKKRVDESYQASQRRASNVMSSLLQQAISIELLKANPDFGAVCDAVTKGRRFLVDDESSSVFERFGQIPEEIPSEARVNQEVADYREAWGMLSQNRLVREFLNKVPQDPLEMVRACFDLKELPPQLPTHTPRVQVGSTCVVQNQVQAELNEEESARFEKMQAEELDSLHTERDLLLEHRLDSATYARCPSYPRYQEALEAVQRPIEDVDAFELLIEEATALKASVLQELGGTPVQEVLKQKDSSQLKAERKELAAYFDTTSGSERTALRSVLHQLQQNQRPETVDVFLQRARASLEGKKRSLVLEGESVCPRFREAYMKRLQQATEGTVAALQEERTVLCSLESFLGSMQVAPLVRPTQASLSRQYEAAEKAREDLVKALSGIRDAKDLQTAVGLQESVTTARMEYEHRQEELSKSREIEPYGERLDEACQKAVVQFDSAKSDIEQACHVFEENIAAGEREFLEQVQKISPNTIDLLALATARSIVATTEARKRVISMAIDVISKGAATASGQDLLAYNQFLGTIDQAAQQVQDPALSSAIQGAVQVVSDRLKDESRSLPPAQAVAGRVEGVFQRIASFVNRHAPSAVMAAAGYAVSEALPSLIPGSNVVSRGVRLLAVPLAQRIIMNRFVAPRVGQAASAVVGSVFARVAPRLPKALQFPAEQVKKFVSASAKVVVGGLVRGKTLHLDSSFAKNYLYTMGQMAAERTAMHYVSRLSPQMQAASQVGVMGLGMLMGNMSSGAMQTASLMAMASAYQNMMQIAAKPIIDKAVSVLPKNVQPAGRVVAEETVGFVADRYQADVMAYQRRLLAHPVTTLQAAKESIVEMAGNVTETVQKFFRSQSVDAEGFENTSPREVLENLYQTTIDGSGRAVSQQEPSPSIATRTDLPHSMKVGLGLEKMPQPVSTPQDRPADWEGTTPAPSGPSLVQRVQEFVAPTTAQRTLADIAKSMRDGENEPSLEVKSEEAGNTTQREVLENLYQTTIDGSGRVQQRPQKQPELTVLDGFKWSIMHPWRAFVNKESMTEAEAEALLAKKLSASSKQHS